MGFLAQASYFLALNFLVWRSGGGMRAAPESLTTHRPYGRGWRGSGNENGPHPDRDRAAWLQNRLRL